MSDHDQQHPDKFVHHVKRYLLVYYALLLGTAMTVLAFYLPFPNIAINIGVALFIASCKAFLVAGYFMHLISERKVIYTVMAFTVFFFAGLMYLTVSSMRPDNIPHIPNVP
jgi:cytochrome c oxidase subunit IV